MRGVGLGGGGGDIDVTVRYDARIDLKGREREEDIDYSLTACIHPPTHIFGVPNVESSGLVTMTTMAQDETSTTTTRKSATLME